MLLCLKKEFPIFPIFSMLMNYSNYRKSSIPTNVAVNAIVHDGKLLLLVNLLLNFKLYKFKLYIP